MRTRRITVALLTAGLAALSSTSIGHIVAARAAAALPPVCGTWVLEQVASVSELDNVRPQLDAALQTPGVRGLSIRVGWNHVDGNLSIFDRAYEISQAAGKELSIRVMAGRYTPARVFDQGAYSYVDSTGSRIPKPFSDGGSAGNPVFEQQYRAMVSSLATWSRSHGVRLLHLPWYGHLWAEIDNGPELQAAQGYSVAAWAAGHLTLLDIGLAESSPNLAVEFPMSGNWGNAGAEVRSFHDRIVNTEGEWSPQAFVQGNGLGVYASNPAGARPIHSGIQMFDGGQYAWAGIYAYAASLQTTYVEIYTSSFTGNANGALAAASSNFSNNFNDACLYGPPTPAPDTIAPETTIASPTNGATLRVHRVRIRGVATDEVGVSVVNVAILNKATGLWWRRDGTWGRYQPHKAKLSAGGSISTGWHLRWMPRSAGSFLIVARARDAAGNKDRTRDRASIKLRRRHQRYPVTGRPGPTQDRGRSRRRRDAFAARSPHVASAGRARG